MTPHTHRTAIIIGIIAVVIVLGVSWRWYGTQNPTPHEPPTPGTNTLPNTTEPPRPTPAPSTENKTESDGTITFTYSPSVFGIATNSERILVKSYIPPCGDGTNNFNYCLYYKDTAYAGTNFESAGVRIQKRPDLSTETACLHTPPMGLLSSNTRANSVYTGVGFATSGFWPISDAGAGHVAGGEIYRLAYTDPLTGDLLCYEFETRIGTTQFGNYPAGSIREFTSTDKITVQSALRSILEHITLPNDTLLVFPNPADRTRS